MKQAIAGTMSVAFCLGSTSGSREKKKDNKKLYVLNNILMFYIFGQLVNIVLSTYITYLSLICW